MFFVSDAWAQGADGAAAAGGPLAQFFGGPSSTIVMFALMFGIMYFMLIRPQNEEKKKKLEKALDALQKGDKVLTTSGIVATVVTIDKERAVLKINDDVKVEFVRAAIAQVLTDKK